MRSRHSLSQLLGFTVLVTLSLLAVTALGWSAYGTQMNQHAADLLFRLRGEQSAGVERIAIVAIDDETLARFGNLPLDRRLVAAALTRICSGRPKVIALDLLFPEPSNPEGDQALLAALQACPQTVLAGGLVKSLVKEYPADPRPARWLHPLPSFAEAAAAIGHVHADPDLDGVSRRILLAKSVAGERRWALALEALRIQTGQSGPVVEDERTLAVSSHMIPASRERRRALLINYAGGEGVFPRYSLGQVVTGELTPDTFAGRAVLLGVTAQGAGDRLFTPFSSPGRGMPGVEIHAHILHMLMSDSFLEPLRATTSLAIMAGIAAMVAAALRTLTGVWLAVALTVVAVAVHTVPYVLFTSRQLLAPAFSFSLALWGPLLVGGIFQYLTVWRRLVAADATSRRFRDHLDLVAHEMRSPLTAIQGSSEVMSRYPLDEARRQQLTELIHRESRRLATLVERFLDVERLSAGEMELRRQSVSLRSLVERTRERAQPLAERKNIQVRAVTSGELETVGDSELLEFALYNLLSNAIKYSPEGSAVEVTVRANADLGMAFLDVSDQGPGIAAADQARIFDRFYRSETAQRSGQPGLGLGLSIVKEIASHHGGTVLLESGPGRGSKFTLALPLANGDGDRH